MIKDIKMGTASVIRDVLKLKPKEVPYSEIKNNTYFEYNGNIYLKSIHGYVANQNCETISFANKENEPSIDGLIVRPLEVKIEYDYILVDENGKERTWR